MIDILITLFYFIVALTVLVGIHEFGHFWVARRCGVRVEQFSIGFGKPLFSWRDRHGTEFMFAAIPLGGYVKMVDERVGNVKEEDIPNAFTSKSPLQRLAIISAGPVANFLLAILIFWMVFLGGERGVAPIIGEVESKSIAEQAGFESDMEILEIDGSSTTTWRDVSQRLFDFIGYSGSIPFVVSYPDSAIRYEIPVEVRNWLASSESPVPIRDLGLMPAMIFESLIISAVDESGAGYEAGLRANYQLVSVNNQIIKSVDQFIQVVSASAGRAVALDVQIKLDDETNKFVEDQIIAIPRSVIRDGKQVGQLGIQLRPLVTYPESMYRDVDYTVISAFPRAIEETAATSLQIVKSIGKLLMGDLSPKTLSGPITIAKVAGDTARSGFDNFIRFIAILSIMLGVMNLLPIPVLDGGHIAYIILEMLKGSPVSESVQIAGYKIGFAMLMGLMFYATFNDLMRPF